VHLLYTLAILGHARVTALAGDRDVARREYTNVLALWNDADPAFGSAQVARGESASLR